MIDGIRGSVDVRVSDFRLSQLTTSYPEGSVSFPMSGGERSAKTPTIGDVELARLREDVIGKMKERRAGFQVTTQAPKRKSSSVVRSEREEVL